MTTVSERLVAAGLKLPTWSGDAGEIAEIERRRAVRIGNRVLIGPILQMAPALCAGLVRLDSRANELIFAKEGEELGLLPEGHPQRAMQISVISMFLHALHFASTTAGNGVNDLQRAIRADVAVLVTPAFDRLLFIQILIRQAFLSAFGADALPIVSVTGVSALPRQAFMSGTFEFALRPDASNPNE